MSSRRRHPFVNTEFRALRKVAQVHSEAVCHGVILSALREPQESPITCHGLQQGGPTHMPAAAMHDVTLCSNPNPTAILDFPAGRHFPRILPLTTITLASTSPATLYSHLYLKSLQGLSGCFPLARF